MTKPTPTVVGMHNPNLDARARVDDDGLLWFCGQWVAIPEAQVAAVALLVERQNGLVRLDELADAQRASGGATNDGALRQLVHRIRYRVEGLGLRVLAVRGRGVVLATGEPLSV